MENLIARLPIGPLEHMRCVCRGVVEKQRREIFKALGMLRIAFFVDVTGHCDP